MWCLLIRLCRLNLCRSGALAWCLGVESFQQLLLSDSSLHLSSHFLPFQDLFSQTLLLFDFHTILPRLLVLIRVLWCRAGRCAQDFLANDCPACSPELCFALRSNLASSSAAVKHGLSVLPRTHPRRCPGNRLDVGSGGGGGGGRAGTVHVCVARCYRELP